MNAGNAGIRRAAWAASLAAATMAFQGIDPPAAQAAKPTPAQALALKPIQADVDYELPAADAVEKCSVEPKSIGGLSGWLVVDASGQLLRRFLDTNDDKKVDQWCYYKNGIEVYRDVDSTFNGKADQYRWLGTAGMRWGLDANEDGRIDRWKAISAEEVAAEVTAALKTKDAARFAALLLSNEELATLGLGTVRKLEVEKKLADARTGFAKLAADQTTVKPTTTWLNFAASQPGIVPAGTEDSTKDLIVYENVAAIIDTDGQHGQIILGTLVQVAGAWRLIDLPSTLGESQTAGTSAGYFFQASAPITPQVAATASDGLSERAQQLIKSLEQIDKSLETADPAASLKLNTQRADILEQLIAESKTVEERDTWLRQFADTISAAVQANGYGEGVERLATLFTKLQADPKNATHAAYVRFRYLSAEYARSLQAANADFPKIQEKWLKDLEAYIAAYPQSEDAPDAMLQLAIGKEFAGEAEAATTIYGRIATAFPQSEAAKKGAGAKRRLESVGREIPLQATALDGKAVSLAAYRGKTVLIHYWATWCEPCKEDMAELKKLQSKYAAKGLTLIGVNLDSERESAVAYLRGAPLSWPQLYEPGGLESRLANEMGILTLPTMILIDSQGKVLNRNIHAAELDEELSKRLK